MVVTPRGTKTFRYNYRINKRRETLTIGRYGDGGISLSDARELCLNAKRSLALGVSPALDKQRNKHGFVNFKTFGAASEYWFAKNSATGITHPIIRRVYDQEIAPYWKDRSLTEISPRDLWILCLSIRRRGEASTAVLAHNLVKRVFRFARYYGVRSENPAVGVKVSSVPKFSQKNRVLSPLEIGIMFRELPHVAWDPTIKLALRLIFLTLVRTSEFLGAVWSEVDFNNAVWIVPKERMHHRKSHNVYLSKQVLEILAALKVCAGGSKYLLPSKFDRDEPMSRSSFSGLAKSLVKRAEEKQLLLEKFSMADLQRTGAVMLSELGFNSDWIAKCVAHGGGRSSRIIYSDAEYEHQRCHMLQEWANTVDAWREGRRTRPS